MTNLTVRGFELLKVTDVDAPGGLSLELSCHSGLLSACFDLMAGRTGLAIGTRATACDPMPRRVRQVLEAPG